MIEQEDEEDELALGESNVHSKQMIRLIKAVHTKNKEYMHVHKSTYSCH